jgi:hypothetical protein
VRMRVGGRSEGKIVWINLRWVRLGGSAMSWRRELIGLLELCAGRSRSSTSSEMMRFTCVLSAESWYLLAYSGTPYVLRQEAVSLRNVKSYA